VVRDVWITTDLELLKLVVLEDLKLLKDYCNSVVLVSLIRFVNGFVNTFNIQIIHQIIL